VKSRSALRGIKRQVLQTASYQLSVNPTKIKLNQNENPYDFPEDLKQEVFRRAGAIPWSRYPEFVPDSLQEKLGVASGWPKEGVLVGNGSNELLQAALMVLVGPRTRVAFPSPTFTVYSLITRILGGKVLPIPLREDMTFDVEALISRAEGAKAGAMVIASPNNPTGTVLPAWGLERILKEFSGFLLLDEAYYEFCGTTGLAYLENHPRLIITRTFSKAMGMAGLRVGYLLAQPRLVREIGKAKLPYNLNRFSLTAAEVALENRGRFQGSIDRILQERERMGDSLRRIPGIRTYPSDANFFLIEFPGPPGEVYQQLIAQGILIRDVSAYPMLSRCLRVSVGTPSENDRFLEALCAAVERPATLPRDIR